MKKPENIHSFPRGKHRFDALLLALRPFLWICNLMAPSGLLLIALSLFSSGLFMMGDLFNLNKERTRSLKKSVFTEGHLHLITAFILAPLLTLIGFLSISYTLPWGALWSLVYILSFCGLDRLTRPFLQSFRWILMGLFQALAAFTTTLLAH
jgi:hypothetical protein